MTPRNILQACSVVFALTLSGCATTPPVPMHYVNSDDIITWPALPEVPRYSHIGELTGEANFQDEGSEKTRHNVLQWLVGLLTGDALPVELEQPQAGTVDAHGRVYVSDIGRNAVFVFDSVSNQLHIWEWAGSYQRFESPIGVAIGPDNTILVADSELKVIVQLNDEGKPIKQFGMDLLKRPTGIARDAERERIYVADTHAHDIKVFNDAGQLLDTLGKRGEDAGEFNYPTHISFANDLLYITDRLNSRIQVFTPDGDNLRAFGERGLYVGNLPHPKGVAADSDGNIYVTESYYDHLLIYNAEGKLLLPIGGAGAGIGQFYLPAGVWVDNNRIYIADMYNSRVVVLQYLGGD